MFNRCYSPTSVLLVSLMALFSPQIGVAAEGRTGEQVYRQLCARCHGAVGEGTKDNYPRSLAGNRSLARIIHDPSRR
jgi:cytochrome c